MTDSDSAPQTAAADAVRTPTFSWVGDRCLRLSFGETASDETLAVVRAAFERLQRNRLRGVADIVPAYTTLLIRFEPDSDWNGAEESVRQSMRSLDPLERAEAARLVEIPVCYESAFAPDLEQVAIDCRMSVTDTIAQHADANYSVAFIGFTPGFAYLTGLPERLHSPRLERPRVRVPAGSVGIAGGQTGIYPRETPGGWKLIGRTPLRLFDPSRAGPSLLASGDCVRFVPIDANAFAAMAENEPRV